MRDRISIIMPVLNEASRITRAIRAVREGGQWHEIVVVDGGSSDDTVERAQATGHCIVMSSDRGRAKQMNAGARAATGDIVLFLHADVTLGPNAHRIVLDALADGKAQGGAFKTWTVPDGIHDDGVGPSGGASRSSAPWWAPVIHLADIRSRYTRFPYGDQAIFVRRTAFEAVGGFPEQPLLEDLEFSRRMNRLGPLKRVDACVRVSGRRFIARPVSYFVLMNLIPLLYAAGVSAERLEHWYGHVR